VAVTYSFVLRNLGQRPWAVELDDAFVLFGDRKAPVTCHGRGAPSGSFGLEPSVSWRVDCSIVIAREQLARGDVEAVLRIPLRCDVEREELQFRYWFREEDGA